MKHQKLKIHNLFNIPSFSCSFRATKGKTNTSARVWSMRRTSDRTLSLTSWKAPWCHWGCPGSRRKASGAADADWMATTVSVSIKTGTALKTDFMAVRWWKSGSGYFWSSLPSPIDKSRSSGFISFSSSPRSRISKNAPLFINNYDSASGHWHCRSISVRSLQSSDQ